MKGISSPPYTPATDVTHIKTGQYTGNGGDNRDIDIGVNLAAKNNVWVIIKGTTEFYAVHRTDHQVGDLTMWFRDNPPVSDKIQSLTATGFEVGNSDEVNEDTTVFTYIAFWEDP